MMRFKHFCALFLALLITFSAVGCAAQKPIPTDTPDTSVAPSSPTEDTQPSSAATQATVSTQPEATGSTETKPPTVPPVTTPATEEPTLPPVTEPTVPQQVTQPTAPPVTQPPVTTPTEPEHSGGIPRQVTVEASGVLVKRSEKALIDYSNTKDGYVMVCHTAPTDKKLKAQVKGPSTTYTYNLTPEKWTAFPLSDENGTYKITIYQNTGGTKYATLLSLSVDVAMTDEFAPFLRSNQYVDFDAAPKAVAKAAALTAGITEPLKKVEKVYDFVICNLTYDKELAASVTSGYLPNLDKVLEKKKGICFDYAALMTGMLRSQGVPTKLVVGYAGDVYHAWISVWSETDGWVDGVIWFDGATWQRMDPTFAASGGTNPDIMDYIGTGSNYTPKYFY